VPYVHRSEITVKGTIRTSRTSTEFAWPRCSMQLEILHLLA